METKYTTSKIKSSNEKGAIVEALLFIANELSTLNTHLTSTNLKTPMT